MYTKTLRADLEDMRGVDIQATTSPKSPVNPYMLQ